LNIADGVLGDVAVISSIPGSIRANHYHETDWHLSFLLSGSMRYSWKSLDTEDKGQIDIGAGTLFFTPEKTIHQMLFLKESIFIAISKLGRSKLNYESDTVRVNKLVLDEDK
jgi:dTDP-4-dehydrorhamnose 3,5-epimerase-like enzyme